MSKDCGDFHRFASAAAPCAGRSLGVFEKAYVAHLRMCYRLLDAAPVADLPLRFDMFTLSLIDRARLPDVPERFFEINASLGLHAALEDLGSVVLPPVLCSTESQARAFLLSLIDRLKCVAAKDLKVLCVGVEPSAVSSIDEQAAECAELVAALSEGEQTFGGRGLMVLGVDTGSAARNAALRASSALWRLFPS